MLNTNLHNRNKVGLGNFFSIWRGFVVMLWHRDYTNRLDLFRYSLRRSKKHTHTSQQAHVYICGAADYMNRRGKDGWMKGKEGGGGVEKACQEPPPPPLTTSYPVPPPLPVISTPPRVVSNLVFVHHQPITWQPCPYPQHRRDAAAWWGFCILNSISWWDKGCRNRALPLC